MESGIEIARLRIEIGTKDGKPDRDRGKGSVSRIEIQDRD
jgi:hypothetical protein